MRRGAALTFLLAAAGAGFALHRNGLAPAGAPESSIAAVATRASVPLVLGVDTLMKNVDEHRGPVVVEGVVRSASTETKLVELVDCEEFRSCGTTTCAKLILPVRWSGRAPTPRETVRATGQVREDAGKLVFVAETLDVKEVAK